MWAFSMYHENPVTVMARLRNSFLTFAEVKMRGATASAFSDCSELFLPKASTLLRGCCHSQVSLVFAFCSYIPFTRASYVQLVLACNGSDALTLRNYQQHQSVLKALNQATGLDCRLQAARDINQKVLCFVFSMDSVSQFCASETISSALVPISLALNICYLVW